MPARDRLLDVALASCVELPEPDFDERPLVAALEQAGLSCAVLGWDDPGADFAAARMVLLRSTWNYPERPAEFAAWLERVASRVPVWNPPPVVRWNLHKGYLLDLERRGVPVVPTLLLRAGERVDLASVLAERGWRDVVIKPAISAASYRTLRAGRDDLPRAAAHLAALLAERDALVQPYLPSVEDHGERAIVWIDGEITHAVRKAPRFAGEDESVSGPVPVGPDEAALAERAIAAVDGDLLYARIDVAPGPDGRPVVMELELIEPSLFFPQQRAALDRFVSG
ncbi:MAG: hypothetical protein D6738_13755, partial [Acidobacteria bacterium]